MGNAPALLAIDLGTSSVKAIVTSLAGAILGSGSGDYPIDQPQPGWAEQEPERWWSQSCAATRQALATAKIAPAAIAAIGLSGQMHGTVMLDEQAQLIRPAVIWPDRRSAQQVTELTDQIGAEQLLAIAGSPLATGFLAATVRWFQQKEPATWDRVRTLLLPKDWLRWRMTGALASDPSDGAGTLLLDQRTRHWSPTLLAALELDLSLLPPLLPSTAQAGKLTVRAAAQLGLPAGIPVVTGGSDTPCGALGAGAVQPGVLLFSLSTGGQLITPVADVQTDRRGRIHTFCGVLESGSQQAGWYQMGAILAAGLALHWLRDNVLQLTGEGNERYRRMDEWAAGCEPGADGLYFLPYLAGERTPHMDPTAQALFFGLTLRHGRGELVRAVMEGVAFAALDAFRVLQEVGADAERITLAGGGARSAVWRQIVADIFALPVAPLLRSEQSALGAALLAGHGAGLFDAAGASAQWAAFGPITPPRPAYAERYQTGFATFRELYRRNRDLFQR